MPKISVIIVNYKSEDYLKRCLASIQEAFSSAGDLEIIVVNNDPDTSLTELKNNWPEAFFIDAQKNLGFGGGSNLAAKYARGEWLFFLNPDTEIHSINFNEVFSLFEKRPKLGILGCRVVNRSGQTFPWTAGYDTSLFELVRNNLGFSRSERVWNTRQMTLTDWVSGTALMMSKVLFEKLRGFDEKFFMYFEDMDLCRRARQAGYAVLYHPEFTVYHEGGKSYEKITDQKKDYYRSQKYYFQKHRHPLEWQIVRLLSKFL